jgi:hypothetical protein
VWWDRDGYRGWSDAKPTSDDPMHELRKLSDEVDEMIEAPLKAEFAKLEAAVRDREERKRHIEIVRINHEKWLTNPPRSDLPDTWPELARVLNLPTSTEEEENKSGVDAEERKRESLFNEDLPL